MAPEPGCFGTAPCQRRSILARKKKSNKQAQRAMAPFLQETGAIFISFCAREGPQTSCFSMIGERSDQCDPNHQIHTGFSHGHVLSSNVFAVAETSSGWALIPRFHPRLGAWGPPQRRVFVCTETLLDTAMPGCVSTSAMLADPSRGSTNAMLAKPTPHR